MNRSRLTSLTLTLLVVAALAAPLAAQDAFPTKPITVWVGSPERAVAGESSPVGFRHGPRQEWRRQPLQRTGDSWFSSRPRHLPDGRSHVERLLIERVECDRTSRIPL